MSVDPRSTLDALRAQLEQLSPERRALVEKQLRSRVAPATTIPRRADVGPAPLTFNQELLWALDQAVPDLVAYNVPRVLRVRGTLDVDALERALSGLVARHETLRTRFVAGPEGPRQVVGVPERVAIDRRDLREIPAGEREALAQRIVVEATRYRFDLARDLLLRATVLQLADAEWMVLLLTHHIVCDEWSREVTFRDLGVLYEAERGASPPPLSPLPVQYADYAAWQREALDAGALAPAMQYWRDQLASPPVLELPTDRPRRPLPSFAGSRRRYAIAPELLTSLHSLARAHDATLHMVLLAAYGILLGRQSGQDDILIGTPISGRRMSELEGIVGYFPNTLVLRTQLGGDPTFADLLGRVRATCLAAYDHADVPLERLALELRANGQLGPTPLFNVWFVLGAPDASQLELAGARVETCAVDFDTAKFDLALSAAELGGELRVVLEYRTELFDAASIDRFFDQYRTLLESIVAAPSSRLSALAILDSGARDLVLRQFNDTARQYPDTTLVALLRAQGRRTSEAVAVEDERRTLTFAELDRSSDILAGLLVERGARAGARVAVCAERSVELVVALVGVLKTGAAYVPLDPQYPAERLVFMLEDAAPAVVVTTSALTERIPALCADGREVVCVDTVEPLLTDTTALIAAAAPTPTDAAYMIYTSGSTGRPKGAINAHRGIVNRLLWMQDSYALAARDVVLQKTPASFDVSVWEFFWPLITGARLVMARPGGHRDTRYLIEAITSRGVTVCHFVPSMLRAFLADPDAARCTTLRDVMASGEALPPDLVAEFYRVLPHARLHNLYGPTECAVDVTAWACPPTAAAPAVVPIGRPIANTSMYVLDRDRAPLPVGVPGELYIGGTQVGLGYHARPALTAERFVPDPFARTPGARMYRTGDRARWRADGTIEYLGRLDDQVKLRGFRIELGEIESALASHSAVRAAAVNAHTDETGTRLIAYVVPEAGEGRDDEAVAHWANVFDQTYGSSVSVDAPESGFNIAGWVSSYDKMPIPAGEMREWVDTTCERIRALAPRRVLEIGCGTGLLLFRIAPHVEHYHGIDISEVGLHAIAADPAFASIADRVTLGVTPADDLARFTPGAFDTIVINSVAQYFPDAEYLVRVLEQAARLVGDGGTIFIGDVRLRPMLEVLHTSVVLHQASDDLSAGDARARVQQRMWTDAELVIDPDLFFAFGASRAGGATAEVFIKRGHASNELTKFRGDVVLQIGTATQPVPSVARATSLADVRELLGGCPDLVRITDVVDPRVARDVALHAALASAPAQSTVRDLMAVAASHGQLGIDPESLAAIDPEYEVALHWPASGTPGRYDATFRRRAHAATAAHVGSRTIAHVASPTPAAAPTPRSWSEYVHHPAADAFSMAEAEALRRHLQAQLPDYMVPAAFVRVDALPLTPSGKVDRRALTPPQVWQAARAYTPPRTPTERAIAAIWANVLRMEYVGVDDGFLDVGGHSLLAVRIAARIRRELGVPVPLDALLRGQTVAQLAESVDAMVAEGPPQDDDIALAPIDRGAFVRRATTGAAT